MKNIVKNPIFRKVFVNGLISMLNEYSRGYNRGKQEDLTLHIKAFLRDKKFANKIIPELSNEELHTLFEFAIENNIDLYSEFKTVRVKIDKIDSSLVSNIKAGGFYSWNKRSVAKGAFLSAILKPKFKNWKFLAEETIRYYNSTYYIDTEFISYALSLWAKKDYESFKETYLVGLKKKAWQIRSASYAATILSGNLDLKYARRMRSDASESASENALTTLFNNSALYPNYIELVTQFTDTRYYSVGCLLAKRLPVESLISLLGNENAPKNIIEERIREASKAEELRKKEAEGE